MTSPPNADLLSRAARALRDEANSEAELDGPSAVGAWQGMHGWHDVSRDVRRAARRRRVAFIAGLQLVAAVVGVGAWAAVSGRLPALFSPRAPSVRPPAPVPAYHARTRRPAPVPDEPPAPPEAPEPAVDVAVPVFPPRPARPARQPEQCGRHGSGAARTGPCAHPGAGGRSRARLRSRRGLPAGAPRSLRAPRLRGRARTVGAISGRRGRQLDDRSAIQPRHRARPPSPGRRGDRRALALRRR